MAGQGWRHAACRQYSPQQGMHHPCPPWAEVQGTFAIQSSMLRDRNASPQMSHHPLPHLLGRQQWCRGCVSKNPSYILLPTSPSSQKHCPAVVTGPASAHSPGDTHRDPPAPTPGRSGCHHGFCQLQHSPMLQGQAGERSEILAQPRGHQSQSTQRGEPQGICLQILSGPTAICVSKLLLPKTAETVQP